MEASHINRIHVTATVIERSLLTIQVIVEYILCRYFSQIWYRLCIGNNYLSIQIIITFQWWEGTNDAIAANHVMLSTCSQLEFKCELSDTSSSRCSLYCIFEYKQSDNQQCVCYFFIFCFGIVLKHFCFTRQLTVERRTEHKGKRQAAEFRSWTRSHVLSSWSVHLQRFHDNMFDPEQHKASSQFTRSRFLSHSPLWVNGCKANGSHEERWCFCSAEEKQG